MREYYFSLTPEERLDIAQHLREQYYKIKKIKHPRIDKNCFRVITKDES